MQAAGQPSETLANQPARGKANKQPSYPPFRQSASQPAIRMPFKHLLLPAMRLSLYPSPSSLLFFPVASSDCERDREKDGERNVKGYRERERERDGRKGGREGRDIERGAWQEARGA